jgi:hypothetical protein
MFILLPLPHIKDLKQHPASHFRSAHELSANHVEDQIWVKSSPCHHFRTVKSASQPAFHLQQHLTMPGTSNRKMGQKVDLDFTLRKVFGKSSFRYGVYTAIHLHKLMPV